jgi:amino acid transporter
VAAVGAWPLVLESWRESHSFIVGALLSVAVFSFCIVGAACLGSTGSTATLVSGILVAEAMAWFLLPYFSYPREANIDNDAISFLRANIRYQRILNTAGAGLAPNYGSYYGIPQLNYMTCRLRKPLRNISRRFSIPMLTKMILYLTGRYKMPIAPQF